MFIPVLCAALIWSGGAVKGAPAPGGGGSISSVGAFYGTPRPKMEQGLPVGITGIVLFSDVYPDKGWNPVFLRDVTGRLYLRLPKGQNPPEAGTLVRLTGRTGLRDGARVVLLPQIEVLGQGRLPAPVPLNTDTLYDSAPQTEMVGLDGIVRTWERNSGRLRMDVMHGRLRLRVVVKNFEP